jgi:hypothetical protein
MTKRAAEQGSELVRRLLAFARRQKLEPQPIDLAALKEAVSDLLTTRSAAWSTSNGGSTRRACGTRSPTRPSSSSRWST